MKQLVAMENRAGLYVSHSPTTRFGQAPFAAYVTNVSKIDGRKIFRFGAYLRLGTPFLS